MDQHQHQHQHQHHHHHHGDGGCKDPSAHGDIEKWNKEHFDNVAASIWEMPAVKQLGEQITKELQTQFDWFGVRKSQDGAETRMLDYACGNGIVSRSLASRVDIIRGMDLSPGMVEQYNKRAREEDHDEAKMHAVTGNLLDDDASASLPADFVDFDLIVISLALHHVTDPETMISKLAGRLARGGVLVVLDWVSSSSPDGIAGFKVPADEPVRHTVTQTGFDEGELKHAYEKAGLGGWEWRLFEERSELPPQFGGARQVFLARGTKA